MQEAVIAPETTILLYTDGLNEATNADNEGFGKDRIFDELNRAIQDGQTSSKSVIDRMNQAVHTFVGDAKQSDDLTMLCIKFKACGLSQTPLSSTSQSASDVQG